MDWISGGRRRSARCARCVIVRCAALTPVVSESRDDHAMPMAVYMDLAPQVRWLSRDWSCWQWH